MKELIKKISNDPATRHETSSNYVSLCRKEKKKIPRSKEDNILGSIYPVDTFT